VIFEVDVFVFKSALNDCNVEFGGIFTSFTLAEINLSTFVKVKVLVALRINSERLKVEVFVLNINISKSYFCVSHSMSIHFLRHSLRILNHKLEVLMTSSGVEFVQCVIRH